MSTDTGTSTNAGPLTGSSASSAQAPRRILLVTGGIGGGHHAAARAIEERARQAWPGVDVAWTDTLDGMGRGTGPLFRAVYAGCMRRLPWLYELYFWLLWHVRPFRAGTRAVIGAWSARGLAAQVAAHSPDLVVAVFPEGITGLGRLRRRGTTTEGQAIGRGQRREDRRAVGGPHDRARPLQGRRHREPALPEGRRAPDRQHVLLAVHAIAGGRPGRLWEAVALLPHADRARGEPGLLGQLLDGQ